MATTVKNILSLNQEEAMDFFMKSEQYHGFELPEYFTFDEVLKYVRETVGDALYEECVQEGLLPDELSDVNLDILLNKDGGYAVRSIMQANPFLYFFLVREVCCEENWNQVKALFDKFKVPHITSCAIPVIPNCYGSVNPQTFDWTFSLKGTSLETESESLIAKNIQRYLRVFQQGRNIGIPRGRAIFDLIHPWWKRTSFLSRLHPDSPRECWVGAVTTPFASASW